MKPARAVDPVDSPEVVALRKSIRGEPLTDVERTLLQARVEAATSAGKVMAATPHANVMSELEERRLREQSSPRKK